MSELKSWGFRRDFHVPSGGCVMANTGEEATELVNWIYGYANTYVFCAMTGELFYNGKKQDD